MAFESIAEGFVLSSVEVIYIFLHKFIKFPGGTWQFLVSLQSFPVLQFDTNICIFILLSWYFWELFWKEQIKANSNCRTQWQVPLSLCLVSERRQGGLLSKGIIAVFLEEDGKLLTSHDRNPPG